MPKAKKLSPEAVSSLFWLALEQAGNKEAVREALQPGRHTVELEIKGWIDGKLQEVRQRLAGALTVDNNGAVIFRY